MLYVIEFDCVVLCLYQYYSIIGKSIVKFLCENFFWNERYVYFDFSSFVYFFFYVW